MLTFDLLSEQLQNGKFVILLRKYVGDPLRP